MDADAVVIGAPICNPAVPSTLKSWIDFVIRASKKFNYTSEGATGLVANKKVYAAISSGAVFLEGPRKAFDFTEPYLINEYRNR